MPFQIMGTKKCPETRKALRYFQERRIQHHFVDLQERKVSPGELDNILRFVPEKELLNTGSKLYRQKNMAYMRFDIRTELLEEPLLMATPVVRYKGKAALGFCPEVWEKWNEM